MLKFVFLQKISRIGFIKNFNHYIYNIILHLFICLMEVFYFSQLIRIDVYFLGSYYQASNLIEMTPFFKIVLEMNHNF